MSEEPLINTWEPAEDIYLCRPHRNRRLAHTVTFFFVKLTFEKSSRWPNLPAASDTRWNPAEKGRLGLAGLACCSRTPRTRTRRSWRRTAGGWKGCWFLRIEWLRCRQNKANKSVFCVTKGLSGISVEWKFGWVAWAMFERSGFCVWIVK